MSAETRKKAYKEFWKRYHPSRRGTDKEGRMFIIVHEIEQRRFRRRFVHDLVFNSDLQEMV